MPTRVIRARRRLRAGVTQLVFVLAGLGAGASVPRIGRGPRAPTAQVIDTLLAIGLGLLGAVALIFSVLFLVVQWVSTTFSPRLMLFRDDPIVWRTFGFAVGLVVFCVTAALSIGKRADVSVAVPVLAMLLLFVLIALLRTLQLRAFSAIQLAPALGSIAARGREVLDALYVTDVTEVPATPLPPPRATVTWPHPPAVLQRVWMERLVDAARSADVVIVLREAPGATLHFGDPVADVHGGELPGEVVLRGLALGDERTFEQDPLFAFRLLADVALRALSAAVNDPATAVQTFDGLGDLLGRVAAMPHGPLRLTDRDGVPRLVIPLPECEEFVRTGVDDILFAARSPMVVAGLRTMLRRARERAAPENAGLFDERSALLDGRFAAPPPEPL
ncbi:DUF2254 domain-containing protein [Nocardia sp. NBC_01377]|uniref:DUF2254 family protein n=1 Tax=Nocardia sp. NBC_01377 TaxID=2903595 RepID=UPI0032521E83